MARMALEPIIELLGSGAFLRFLVNSMNYMLYSGFRQKWIIACPTLFYSSVLVRAKIICSQFRKLANSAFNTPDRACPHAAQSFAVTRPAIVTSGAYFSNNPKNSPIRDQLCPSLHAFRNAHHLYELRDTNKRCIR